MNNGRCISMLFVLAAISACGADYDTLWIDRSAGKSVSCGGDRDAKIVLPDERALGCFGYRCPGTDAYTPGSAECLSSTTNPLLSTCADTFFSCFKPTGACVAVSDSQRIEWADGSVIALPEFDSFQRAFVPSGSEDPCILEEIYSTSSDGSSFLVRAP